MVGLGTAPAPCALPHAINLPANLPATTGTSTGTVTPYVATNLRPPYPQCPASRGIKTVQSCWSLNRGFMALSGAGGDVEMLTNAQMQAEIVAALAELKALADGVETVKARLLVLYGRLDVPSPPPLEPAPPPRSATADLLARDLANGYPVDREGLEVRISAGESIRRAVVNSALARMIEGGLVIETVSGDRSTVCISKAGVPLAAPIKPPMTLAIERGILHALDAAPGTDHATVVDAVARLHGVGRVLVQFVLKDMVSEGRLSVQIGAPGERSNAELGRLIVL